MIIDKRKIFYSLIFTAAITGVFALGIWVGKMQYYYVPQPEGMDFSLFWDAYGKLRQNFIDPSKITDQNIIYGAIEGMTKSLGDPYTDFFDPAKAKMFQQDLSGSFEGIGVEIGVKKGRLTIVSPLEGTPGKRAGLMPGDIIVKINGKDTTDMTSDEAVRLIRGPKGTNVVLSIYREDWASTKDITITRDTIKVESVKWQLKNGDVAYLQIFQFDENLSTDFRKIAAEIVASPAKKIVLDLRNNPGGYLEIAQYVAGWFLPKDQVVTIEDFGQNKSDEIYRTQGNASLASYPLVVLINQGSASASEILAGALRDNRNIQLIGTKSFGKGSVQEVLTLKGGSFLKITIAKWMTPKGVSISEVGLEPDLKIEATEQDSKQNKDPQLDKALEIIKDLK